LAFFLVFFFPPPTLTLCSTLSFVDNYSRSEETPTSVPCQVFPGWLLENWKFRTDRVSHRLSRAIQKALPVRCEKVARTCSNVIYIRYKDEIIETTKNILASSFYIVIVNFKYQYLVLFKQEFCK